MAKIVEIFTRASTASTRSSATRSRAYRPYTCSTSAVGFAQAAFVSKTSGRASQSAQTAVHFSIDASKGLAEWVYQELRH